MGTELRQDSEGADSRISSGAPTSAEIDYPADSAQSDEALRDSEERFQLAAVAMAAFVYDTDLLTDQVKCYSAPDGAFGYSLSELPQDLGWWQSRLHPDDRSRVTETWQTYLAGNASQYAIEFRFEHRDGQYVDVLDRGHIVRDAHGRAIRVVGGSSDISERRRLEREREALVTQLDAERARLYEIFRTSPSFFALTRGPDHIFEYVNEAYYQLAGRRDLIGKPIYDVFPEGRKQNYPDIRRQVLEEGVPFSGKEVPLEVEQDGRPHEVRYLDVSFSPYCEADGTRSGVLLHGFDVTEHVLARRNFEQLLAESEGLARVARDARNTAERATAARDELLTVISHEVRTPLSVMDAALTGLLRDAAPSAENVHKTADLLKRAVEWMDRLVRDLVDVTSIEAGRLAVVPVADAPRAIISEVAELFRTRIQDNGLELETITPDNLPLVLADPPRIYQALGNLILNAIKATRPGGRITLCAELDAAGVRFIVDDTGSGIARGNLPYVFDRVWQHHHRTNGGTGLGLTIVRGIVQAHGGEVAVKSRVGKGSKFSFTIPTARA